jgi:hypothetical protein
MPHNGDAHDLDFAFEALQSSYLAVVAAILPIHSDLLRIRARSDRTSRSIQGKRYGDLALAEMSTVLRWWLRSGEVMYDKLKFVAGLIGRSCAVTTNGSLSDLS